MSELKPCPFCGGEAEITRKGNDRTAKRSVTVKCKGCRFQRTDGAIRYGMDWLEEVVTHAWNTRPSPWQPIETAPKDGRRILGYDEHNEEMTVVQWDLRFHWWELSVAGFNAEDGEWTPTHWQPIEPPQ